MSHQSLIPSKLGNHQAIVHSESLHPFDFFGSSFFLSLSDYFLKIFNDRKIEQCPVYKQLIDYINFPEEGKNIPKFKLLFISCVFS